MVTKINFCGHFYFKSQRIYFEWWWCVKNYLHFTCSTSFMLNLNWMEWWKYEFNLNNGKLFEINEKLVFIAMGKDFFKGPPMKRKWSMDLFWNFIKYFDKLVIAIFSKLFKNMGDLWKYMFFGIIPFFHVWSFLTKTKILFLLFTSNYAWLHPGISCFQGFMTLPKWIYMFFYFFAFFLFF